MNTDDHNQRASTNRQGLTPLALDRYAKINAATTIHRYYAPRPGADREGDAVRALERARERCVQALEYTLAHIAATTYEGYIEERRAGLRSSRTVPNLAPGDHDRPTCVVDAGRHERANAAALIDGYYIPRPEEEALGKLAVAFARAREQCEKSVALSLLHVRSIAYDAFEAERRRGIGTYRPRVSTSPPSAIALAKPMQVRSAE